MGIPYKINKADAIVKSFCDRDRELLERKSRAIQRAQDNLVSHASDLFATCIRRCRGLCCQNINPDDIITLLDFISILALGDTSADKLCACVQEETLFTGKCYFLQGDGPCIFAPNLKPERCILTFCGDTHSIQDHIRQVRSKFSNLCWFVRRRRPLMWYGF